MRSALYYPHTTVRNEGLIKTALLLWDRLEYIVPWPHFHSEYRSRSIAEAMELVGARHCPDDDEKRETHSKLKQLLDRKLPPHFYLDRRGGEQYDDSFEDRYEMYSEKLWPNSWRLLQRKRMSGKLVESSDYSLSALGGLTVMSILADCCAGTTRSRVTDRGDAYATVAEFLGNKPDGPKIQRADAHDQLVPISLEVIDAAKISIEALIRLRKREKKETGHTLRDLRHRYVDGLENYVIRLSNEKATKADAKEIQRQFADDMTADIKHLKSELGFARKDALLSTEFIATVLTAGGTVASWLYGLPLSLEGIVTTGGAYVSVGGLLRVRNKYLKEREAIMKRHPMAYLYKARGGLRKRRFV